MSHKRAKVLMVGPVNGQLRLLSDKLRALQKSRAGPFDVCLCAGPFFRQTVVASSSTAATTATEAKGDENKGGEEVDPQKKERDDSQAAAWKDGKDLVDGSLTFDVPVLFVDDGDGPPEGLNVPSMTEALKKDEDEIDLDDDEDGADNDANENDKTEADGEAEENAVKTPEGLLRIAPNLYQLVGDVRNRSRILDSVADIIAVPLPLIDPHSPNKDDGAQKERTSLTIGFLGPKIRLPCKSFDEKARHTSFLGCDVLISGEWG
eukprot:CAMPEP_0183717616 /NCGR_PEP_ID=MMETSP0737-20130205/11189_1 /TAXON_ID=385413 /ORGANISM="Thalassiosira miniscula, Strain CCMP1093" /LENGTH=262 /DNA_ID=CAMNT_0025947089 /DNA_START=88 /DNA_END=873 /DNA_ORIENTATION=+